MAALIASLAGWCLLLHFGIGRLRDPLRRLQWGATPHARRERVARERLTPRLLGWMGRRLPRLLLDRHAGLLAASGSGLNEEQFRGLRLTAAAGFTLLPFSRGPLALLLLGPLTATLGLYLPIFGLKRRAARRSKQVASELPEFMDHLALLLAAGQGLGPALDRSAELGDGPLYQEMRQALWQVHLGRVRAAALDDLCARISSPELTRACRALGRAERFGGPIAASVAEIAADLRSARLQAARADAARAPVKLLFPLVFMILPSFLLLTVGGFVLSILARW